MSDTGMTPEERDLIDDFLADERGELPEIFSDWYQVATDDVHLAVPTDPQDPFSPREKVKTGRHMVPEYIWDQLLRQELLVNGVGSTTAELVEKVDQMAVALQTEMGAAITAEGLAVRQYTHQLLEEHDARDHERHTQVVNQGWWTFGVALGGAVLGLAGLVGVGSLLARKDQASQTLQQFNYDPAQDPLYQEMSARFEEIEKQIEGVSCKIDDLKSAPPKAPRATAPPVYAAQPMHPAMMGWPAMQAMPVAPPPAAPDDDDFDEAINSMDLH